MKLLIVTQKIDENDPVLGFFTNWVAHFSRRFERLVVVCLERGKWNPPANVKIYSLGKETGGTRLGYAWRFLGLIWRLRGEYDGVFVHMNQEYVLLGGLLWRLMRKPVVLWYNHTIGTIYTSTAMKLASAVCHTSPYAYTAGSPKSVRMPAGIDTTVFKKAVAETKADGVVYIGRLAPLKKVDVLIAAVGALALRNIPCSLDIYGAGAGKDASYEASLRQAAAVIGRKDIVTFHGAVPHDKTPMLYASHRAAVNLTPRGNYDKTVLEAMACEALPLVSSGAFADIIPPEFYFTEGDASSLADRLQFAFSMPTDVRISYGKRFRESVVERHDITILAARLAMIFDHLAV